MVPLTTTYVQMPVDLLHEVPGPLKLHHLHGRDRLRREGENQSEWEEWMCHTYPGSRLSEGGSQFTPRGFRTTEQPQSQPENTGLALSSEQRNTFELLKSTDDELHLGAPGWLSQLSVRLRLRS